ncbi:NAD-dependent epimerase/dehydratase family protein [Thermoflexibacter ruber]|uniref:Nucleoside-diphosphate-sugar epimerase n=1 Tax=Thermoflexibacter ruber TaxID=1003 RepID=A0A1I2DAN0_9BACT|nr:NAD-dependent epimerase/dehydratase family protein [Thermoflexibacter ruber]SFE77528.1 Nucleoside-diphosphate-sugar epimerase [Thermoflexibacter ruber]
MVAERYFITGATGLVGSYITRKLVSEGKEVHALKRKDSSLELVEDIAKQITWIEGDILDVSLLFEILPQMTYVIHSAAAVSMLPKDKEKVFKINIEGTANMVNASLKSPIKKFCHVSSVAAIGVPENAHLVNEKASWNEDNTNFIYAKSKHFAEMEVWRGIAEGLNAVIVNPSTVLGVSSLNKSSGQIFNRLRKGIRFYPKGKINLVDASDVAEIVYHLLHHEVSNERFILNAGSIAYKDFFAKVAQVLGTPVPKYALNQSVLSIAYFLSQLASLLGITKTVLPKEIISAMQSTHTYDNKKITDLLHFKFKDLNQSIKEVSEKYKKTK